MIGPNKLEEEPGKERRKERSEKEKRGSTDEGEKKESIKLKFKDHKQERKKTEDKTDK